MLLTSSKGRLSRRRIEREKCLFELQNDKKTKINLNSIQEIQLFESLESDSQSHFGLVKISNWNLDFILNGTTLIELSVHLSRDAILSHLIKADANPSVSSEHPSGFNLSINKYLREIVPSFACFIVKTIVNSRQTAKPGICEICDNQKTILQLANCFHLICEECLWLESILIPKPKYVDLKCPICNEFLIKRREIKVNLTKKESLELFQKLPDKLSLKSVPKKPKFQARSMHELNQMYLGSNKEQRITELFKATNQDNLEKLIALVNAGVDIDAKNEYGHTCLFIANWRKFDKIINFFESMGALDLTDNTGTLFKEVQFENQVELMEGVSTVLLKDIPEHPGHNSFYLDGFFNSEFMNKLDELLKLIPVAPAAKISCSDRFYYCDINGLAQNGIKYAISKAGLGENVIVMPFMRFLDYEHSGGYLPPHTDLFRTDFNGVRSTHTFILYLTDCTEGGETSLLKNLNSTEPLELVKPLRGRLFVFPHLCPHEGRTTISVPKILLRGELAIL